VSLPDPSDYGKHEQDSLGTIPLRLPHYGASLPVAMSRFFRKYATFSGRAGRAEFWWWGLVSFAFSLAMGLLGAALTGDATYIYDQPIAWDAPNVLTTLFGLATLVPSLAVTWRRLHDADLSGGWFFLGLIPILGWAALIIMLARPRVASGIRFDQANYLEHP